MTDFHINSSFEKIAAITSILMLSSLAFPVVFLLDLPPVVQQLTAAISYAVAAFVTLNAIFLPKAISLLKGDVVDENLGVGRRKKKKGEPIFPEAVATHQPTSSSSLVNSSVAAAAEALAPEKILRKLSADDRMLLCRQQVALWQKKMMQCGEGFGSGSGSQGNFSSAASSAVLLSEMQSKSLADLSADNLGTAGAITVPIGAVDEELQSFT